MTQAQLTRLHELVRAAQAVVQRPWEPGEASRPFEFFTDHLDEEGWRLGWTLVAALRETAPDVFRSYGEQTIHRAALDYLVSLTTTSSLAEIADALRAEAAGDEGPWVVLIPLSNANLSRSWAPVGESAALLPSLTSHRVEEEAPGRPPSSWSLRVSGACPIT